MLRVLYLEAELILNARGVVAKSLNLLRAHRENLFGNIETKADLETNVSKTIISKLDIIVLLDVKSVEPNLVLLT